MKGIIVCILLLFSSVVDGNAQTGSYAEYGMIFPKLRGNGYWKSPVMPGFSISAAGVTFSLYASGVTSTRVDSTIHSTAAFMSVGYNYVSQNAILYTAGVLHWSLGAGVGSYGVNNSYGVQLNLQPGIQINFSKTITVAASVYAGYNIYGGGRRDTVSGSSTSGYLSTEKWFLIPQLALRLNTSIFSVAGGGTDSRNYNGAYNPGEYRNRSDVRGDRLSERGVWGYILQSNNIINLYGKMIVGSKKDNRGASLAGGGGVAFRYGLLAADAEWIHGNIGYRNITADDVKHQFAWEMDRKALALGLNVLNIPFPFRRSTLIRLIGGGRLGVETLNSKFQSGYNATGEETKLQSANTKGLLKSAYVNLEIGTLALSGELFGLNDKNGIKYNSALLLGAIWMLPLNRK